MKTYLYLLLIMVFTYSCNLPLSEATKIADIKYDLAITNIQIFDSENKIVLHDRTIIINGDSIVGITDFSQKVHAHKEIDGAGRLVVPGFIDTHTHLSQIFGDGPNGRQNKLEDDGTFRRILSRQFLSYGTTTILDMGQYEEWMDVSLEWQDNPVPEYPNLYLTSMKLISSGDAWPYTYEGFEQIANEEEAKAAVKKYDALGVKYIKLYKFLREPEMQAIVREAEDHSMTVFAHTDMNIVTIPQAIDLGVYNFEHFFTLVPSVLNMTNSWPDVKNAYNIDDPGSIDEEAAKLAFYFRYIDDNPILSKTLTELLTKMARENATISTAIHPIASAAGVNVPGTFSSWNSFPLRNSPYLPNYSDENKEDLRQSVQKMMDALKQAHQLGVKIRIGTDCRYGGEALLSELVLMAKSEFEMKDILQIATRNGAEAMGILSNYGSIAKGKKADLIIFDMNPFEDYMNLLSNKTVIKGGKIFSADESVVPEIVQKISQNGIRSGIEFIENLGVKKVGPEALNEIGFELIKESEIGDAISIFKLKDQIFKREVHSYNDLVESNIYPQGYHLVQTGKVDEAIMLYQYNIQLFPKSGYAHFILAETLLEGGKADLAMPMYRKSIELNPESSFVAQAVKALSNAQ